MAQTLRASILGTIAGGLLAFTPAAIADGRGDWKDYAWQKIDIAKCVADTAGTRACPPYHQKWDWKRNQWVDIAITINGDRLQLTQHLTNNDRYDQDYVCVTALVVDAAGRDLIAHHQNWKISAGQQLSDAFTYASPALDQARAIHIGSKQCRQGAEQDDATYAAVLAGIGN
ncbi:MAG TPA: hypothetical protein VL133_09195 [Devosia sp.]|nr:hypothetical protein [Devosia sp.]